VLPLDLRAAVFLSVLFGTFGILSSSSALAGETLRMSLRPPKGRGAVELCITGALPGAEEALTGAVEDKAPLLGTEEGPTGALEDNAPPLLGAEEGTGALEDKAPPLFGAEEGPTGALEGSESLLLDVNAASLLGAVDDNAPPLLEVEEVLTGAVDVNEFFLSGVDSSSKDLLLSFVRVGLLASILSDITLS